MANVTVAWVVLTMGDRSAELDACLRSIRAASAPQTVCGVVVVNGGGDLGDQNVEGFSLVESPENIGVPAGRHLGLSATSADVVAFLDDDAVVAPDAQRVLVREFSECDVGAVALRIVDEEGRTLRRHVPRLGARHPERAGVVGTFLGGACALRRVAYDQAGGYFGELFYGHEEVELSWRLIDVGWAIRYAPDGRVTHPHTSIARHPDGWRLTGRNRVWIARRSLPWAVAVVHVTAWLVIGVLRVPDSACRRAYVRGWCSGWRSPIDRSSIAFATVWRLTRLGRPPLL